MPKIPSRDEAMLDALVRINLKMDHQNFLLAELVRIAKKGEVLTSKERKDKDEFFKRMAVKPVVASVAPIYDADKATPPADDAA